MNVPKDYDPRYIGIDDVPIEVADSYSIEDKREALFQAESRAELDRNGSEQFDPEDVTPILQTAIANLATHHLTRGAVANDDVTLGDLGDGGDQRKTHADQFKETYDDIIEALAESGPGTQSGSYFGATGNIDSPVSANTGRTSRRHRLGEIDPDDGRLAVHENFIS